MTTNFIEAFLRQMPEAEQAASQALQPAGDAAQRAELAYRTAGNLRMPGLQHA